MNCKKACTQVVPICGAFCVKSETLILIKDMYIPSGLKVDVCSPLSTITEPYSTSLKYIAPGVYILIYIPLPQ